MSSTFSGLYIGRSGLQAARANLQVTGQNIANLNTEGYTRQRVDMSSIPSCGNNMRYSNGNELAIGQGVRTNGVDQIRDPYLDIRYRSEHAKVADSATMANALDNLENVFDEIKNDNGLKKQFNDFMTQLQTLTKNPGDAVSESIVKTSGLMIVKMFNNWSTQLSSIKEQELSYLKNDAIQKANELLKNIAHINKEIKSADISQSEALELKDSRNQMIDQLSQYLPIELEHHDVPVGSGRFVSELNINLVGSNGKKFNLIDHDQYVQVNLSNGKNEAGKDIYNLQLLSSTGSPILATDGTSKFSNEDLLTGTFHGYLTMLNDRGEYDAGFDIKDDSGKITGKTVPTSHGIGYYQDRLDALAQTFADIMNKANSTNKSTTNPPIPPIFNKPMFSAGAGSNKTDGVTAGNISISKSWDDAQGSYITNTKDSVDPGIDNSHSSNNILYMINQFSAKQSYSTPSGENIFEGTMLDYVSDISSTLALEIQDVKRQNTTYSTTLTTIDTQRRATSSVDINEEGVNMLMYNKSLSASSRFMTTIDEALDTIINRMGVVGR